MSYNKRFQAGLADHGRPLGFPLTLALFFFKLSHHIWYLIENPLQKMRFCNPKTSIDSWHLRWCWSARPVLQPSALVACFKGFLPSVWSSASYFKSSALDYSQMQNASIHKFFLAALYMTRLDYVILSPRLTVKNRTIQWLWRKAKLWLRDPGSFPTFPPFGRETHKQKQ